MGKLLIRKSGKVQLVLGKVTLDVTMGTPCSFLQVWELRRGVLGTQFVGLHPKIAPWGSLLGSCWSLVRWLLGSLSL